MRKIPAQFDFDPPASRQIGLVTRCLLILPPAFLLSLKYDLPHIAIIASLLVVVPLFQSASFRLRDRPIIYSLLGAGVLAILPGLLVKIPDTRLTFSDYLMRSHLFLPFLLYSAAISFWFRRTREVTSLCLLVALLSCLACGDVYNTSTLVNVTFAGTTPLLRHYRSTYLTCAVLQCLGTLLLLTADARYDSTRSLASVRSARLLAVLLLIPVLWGARAWFFSLEGSFREWRSHLQQVFQTQQQGYANAFPQETGIGDPSFLLDSPVEVLMRVVADRPPGYLRGNVYRAFSGMRGGMWFADEKDTTDLVESTPEGERNLTVLTFLIGVSGETDTDRMEFRYEGAFRSRIPPLPGNATSVTLDAKSAAVTRDGCVVAENWNPSTGVIATVHTPDPFSAGQDPDAARMAEEDGAMRSEYLALPPGLADRLALLTNEIFGDADPAEMTPKEKIEAVKDFFAENFTYSLGQEDYSPIRGRMYGPLLKFLFDTRTGHCELFATTTALLLRLYGVPARYVAGVVCNQRHPAGYYFATNFDLHAWTEAWLDDEERWVLVEATPPGEGILPDRAVPDSFLGLLRDRIAFQLENLLYWFRRGHPVQIIITAWDEAYGWTVDHVREHPVRSVFELLVPLALIAAAVLWWRGSWRSSRSLSRQMRHLARIMRALQLNVWRRTGVQRKPWQTYCAWAEELGEPLVSECTARYEAIRYAGRPPLPEEIRAFEDAVRAVKRHMPKRRPMTF